MTVVDHRTGEIVEPGAALAPVDQSSAVAVTDYLTKARDWLATAVEVTGPEQIARAKAEIATAAEATRQLGLSKEIQLDAQEMVRRAEYAVRKAATKAQESGEVKERGDNLIPGARTRNPVQPTSSDDRPSPKDFFKNASEYEDANAMGDLDDDAFEEVLDEAKTEGNLSRANVARKAREKAGKSRKSPRRPLIETSRHAGLELIAAVERVERVFTDDRFPAEAEQVAPQLRNHLTSAIETCQGLLDRIND